MSEVVDVTSRNYVAAWMDYRADKVVVLERDAEGTMFRKAYNPPYYFFIPDEEGTYESIFGDKLIRAEFGHKDEYEAAKRAFPLKFESDIAPLKRVLMDNYYERPAPPVQFALIDIEVDYKQSIGFAGPQNPYAPINAVTIYQSWTGKYLTAVLTPPVPDPNGEGEVKWDALPGNNIEKLYATIDELIEKGDLGKGQRPEITICKNETELLYFFVKHIEESDIISGWNSEFYDLPYICERLVLAGGKSLLQRIDHIGVREPRKEMVNRFGSPEPIWKLTGRSHLDYMKLFQKFTFEGRVSYALGNILEEEVGMGKLEYDGTLERLYHDDFPLFVAYNFRDVSGLVDLDGKFKFIAQANQMAHENTVHFDAVLGTVAYVETGITNHAHYKLGKIVHDKRIGSHDRVEGAIVMTPQRGLHGWLAAIDLKSLYPNTIRSLNASPEMIVGQFEGKEADWRAVWKETTDRLTMTFENGSQVIMSGAEWADYLLEKRWCVSAYGTVFDQSRGLGVVADILGFWYNERKRLQGEKKKWTAIVARLPDGPEKDAAKIQEEHFDLLQLTKKISMNSLYGALLNVAFRFGDERLGASTTATGRAISTHMIETAATSMSGVHTPLIKTTTLDKKGSYVHEYHIEDDAIIYGDTDSCYYKCVGATNKEEAVQIADLVAEETNASFPAFMAAAFKCQPSFRTMIGAGREIVGERGLFQAKKKYIIKVVDDEGRAVNKMKSMGSEIKKADTPKVIQQFLKQTVSMILDGQSYDELCVFVNDQRKSILGKKVARSSIFLLGVAKQVNNLDKYLAEYQNPGTVRTAAGRKLAIPGHARASCNYNAALEKFDKGAKSIRSGDKVLVFYLKPNDWDFNAIGFPAELARFPPWFEEHFQVDTKTTESKMFDSKLQGIFDALGKDVPSPQSVLTNSILSF